MHTACYLLLLLLLGPTQLIIISQQYFYWDPGPIITSVRPSVRLSVCPNLVYAQQQQWSGTTTKNNFFVLLTFYFLPKMKVYTYSSSGVQKKNSQIPNVTNTKYFNQSAQILFGVDKFCSEQTNFVRSRQKNFHDPKCTLPATFHYYYYYYYYWDPHDLYIYI